MYCGKGNGTVFLEGRGKECCVEMKLPHGATVPAIGKEQSANSQAMPWLNIGSASVNVKQRFRPANLKRPGEDHGTRPTPPGAA